MDAIAVDVLRRRRRARAAGVVAFLVVLAGLIVYDAADRGGGRATVGGRGVAEPPCPEVAAPDVSPPTYTEAPALELPEGVDYSAVIHTSCGDIALDLLEDVAPMTVANFVFLAEEGFYEGLTWPRIERDFVIQTGDPDGIVGNEVDGPGYTIPDERPRSARRYVYGVVAMANDGPDTGGSQFFIVVHDPVDMTEPAGIEPEYSIFGRVSEDSYDTLDKIARMPVRGGDDVHTAVQPRTPVVIQSIEITTSET